MQCHFKFGHLKGSRVNSCQVPRTTINYTKYRSLAVDEVVLVIFNGDMTA